jgi:hypothetical protein
MSCRSEYGHVDLQPPSVLTSDNSEYSEWRDRVTLPLSAKFFNQIYTPACQLITVLASHPFAIEPESNALLHQFEGIVLHANHFAEKNNLSMRTDPQFRDLANSIKHIRDDPKKFVNIESAVMYEIHQNTFRFIRNTIIANYSATNIEFDAIEKLQKIIIDYLPLVGLTSSKFSISESAYPFYEWAIAYNKDGLAALTKSVRLITMRKKEDGYIKADATELKFLVLDGRVIGHDPKPYYPIN